MKDELDGRTALVTGAAQGIGLAIAGALVARGADVALVDVDPVALQAATQSLGERTLAVHADVSQLPAVQQAVKATVDHSGRLDILINNAGICPMSAFSDITESEWDRVLAVNLKGAFLFCQTALPHLRRSGQHGRIVNIASVAGQMGGVTVGAHYASSKAGLIGLSKSLAQILAPDGVTVNCVAPGTVETDMTQDWSQEVQANLKAKISLGRFARPQEIAEAVLFLASDRARFITGATLDVNGGLYYR